MTDFQALIIGLIQGLTEFIPVSSSGHLVLAQQLFGLNGDLMAFDIFVHFGTLLAVMVVFYDSILSILLGCWTGVKALLLEKQSPLYIYKNSSSIRMATALLVGTVPAGIVGIVLKDRIEALFSTTIPVLAALFVTGSILLITFLAKKGESRINLWRGLVVGIAQAIAIIPGISRSGSTISTALFLKVNRQEAGEFSFLLSIPAIGGATVLALKDYTAVSSLPTHVILIGTAASFVSGYFSLKLLMNIVRRGKIGYFGLYCFAVVIAGAIYFHLN
ncbi:MAG: undecaprenyl-diphosphate phosphatase [Candidatus Latescibacterota bacterium]